jgi:hypothetical protein
LQIVAEHDPQPVGLPAHVYTALVGTIHPADELSVPEVQVEVYGGEYPVPLHRIAVSPRTEDQLGREGEFGFGTAAESVSELPVGIKPFPSSGGPEVNRVVFHAGC